MNAWYWLLPVIASFSGWCCIRVVTALLFSPVKPVKAAGITWHGLIPANHHRIAAELGRLVQKEFSFTTLQQQLTQPATLQQLMPAVEKHIDVFLRDKLPKAMPMLGMFIGDRTIQQLKDTFMGELEELFPQVIADYIQSLEKNTNIEQLVTERINAISAEQMQQYVYAPATAGLNKLAWIGAIIGFLTGLLQLVVVVTA